MIDADSAMMQGLQLLSAEGNLIRAEELPILSDRGVKVFAYLLLSIYQLYL